MGIKITTPRLILREFHKSDAKDLREIATQEYVLKWMPDWEMDEQHFEDWIGRMSQLYGTANAQTARIMLAVTLKGTHQLIGMVGIGNKEEVDNEIEIAYFISRDFSGKGYMTEAAKAMTDWAIHFLDLEYLIAIVELDNISSQKVIKKCGYEQLEQRMILNSGETEIKPFYYYRKYNFLRNSEVDG